MQGRERDAAPPNRAPEAGISAASERKEFLCPPRSRPRHRVLRIVRCGSRAVPAPCMSACRGARQCAGEGAEALRSAAFVRLRAEDLTDTSPACGWDARCKTEAGTAPVRLFRRQCQQYVRCVQPFGSAVLFRRRMAVSVQCFDFRLSSDKKQCGKKEPRLSFRKVVFLMRLYKSGLVSDQRQSMRACLCMPRRFSTFPSGQVKNRLNFPEGCVIIPNKPLPEVFCGLVGFAGSSRLSVYGAEAFLQHVLNMKGMTAASAEGWYEAD